MKERKQNIHNAATTNSYLGMGQLFGILLSLQLRNEEANKASSRMINKFTDSDALILSAVSVDNSVTLST